jgi:CheY-like chemotaxis protein
MMPVLIVDDSREDLALATRVLLQCKLLNPIRTMHSGQQCLDYFAEAHDNAPDRLPCVVFLDLMMSPVSGLQVLQKLQDTPAAKGSVLVMLSGACDYTTVRQGYQLGAATFLVKPLTADEVLRTLRCLRGVSVKAQPRGNLIVAAAGEDRPLAAEHPSVTA